MLEKKKNDKVYLYGKNALMEALMARPDVIGKVFLSSTMRKDDAVVRLLNKHKINISDLKEEEGKNKFKNLVDSNEILSRHRSNGNLPKLPIDRKRVEVPFEDSLLINKGKNSKSKNKRSRSKSINMKKNKGHY